MSRALKLFILAAIVAMTGVFAAFAWAHWDAIVHLQTLPPLLRKRLISGLIAVAFCPLWLGLGALVVNRQLTRRDIALAADHRRFYETSLAITVVFVAAAEAWIAFGAEHLRAAGREFVPRGVLVFCGVFAAVYGNFHAKAGPPSGELAPAPAVWIRGMLRNGWARSCWVSPSPSWRSPCRSSCCRSSPGAWSPPPCRSGARSCASFGRRARHSRTLDRSDGAGIV